MNNIHKVVWSDYLLILLLGFMMFVVMMTFLHIRNDTDADKTLIEESFTMTFKRPKGGEERLVETVRLSCMVGPSKGAVEGNLWCQETILFEGVHQHDEGY